MNARRNTRQRETILEVIQHAKGPLGVTEILERARIGIPGLGLATVYRTLAMLKEGGQVLEVNLPGEESRFEPGTRIVLYRETSPTPVTIYEDPSVNYDPAFAPDGYHIVFVSTLTGHDELLVTNRDATEVRQIAGRAGRFGIYETGYVNVLEDDERILIAHMLATDDTVDLEKLPIAPNFGQIAAIELQLHTNKLSECLEYFAQRLRFTHDLFELGNVSAQYSQALLVDEFAPNMNLQDKFVFARAPISINLNVEKTIF